MQPGAGTDNQIPHKKASRKGKNSHPSEHSRNRQNQLYPPAQCIDPLDSRNGTQTFKIRREKDHKYVYRNTAHIDHPCSQIDAMGLLPCNISYIGNPRPKKQKEKNCRHHTVELSRRAVQCLEKTVITLFHGSRSIAPYPLF